MIHSDHGYQVHVMGMHTTRLDSGLVPSMGFLGECNDSGQTELVWAGCKSRY